MKRCITLAARLYPTVWRKRYGDEFEALLEEVEPGWRELMDVVGGALKMQLTNGSAYWKFGLAFCVVGAVVGGLGSYAVPEEYISTAVLRITPTEMPENGNAPLELEPVMRVEQEVLSRTSLSGLIQDPSLDLYGSERQRRPLEEVIENMRSKALHISVSGNVLRVSFVYTDQRKAQAVVRNIVDRFTNAFAYQRSINAHMPGAIPIKQELEILDPPNLPRDPIFPNRVSAMVTGLGCGLILGLLVAAFWRQPRPALLFTSFAIVGCVAGGSISLFTSRHYTSSASIRIVPFDRLSGTEEGRRWLGQMTGRVLSRESLTELVLRLNLYDYERSREPLEGVLERLRQRDLHISLNHSGTVLRLEFNYRDQAKAQATLAAVIKKIMAVSKDDIQASDRPGSEKQSGVVEYLDNASYPVRPVWPNRMGFTLYIAMGLAGGLIAACITMRSRRLRVVTEPRS